MLKEKLGIAAKICCRCQFTCINNISLTLKIIKKLQVYDVFREHRDELNCSNSLNFKPFFWKDPQLFMNSHLAAELLWRYFYIFRGYRNGVLAENRLKMQKIPEKLLNCLNIIQTIKIHSKLLHLMSWGFRYNQRKNLESRSPIFVQTCLRGKFYWCLLVALLANLCKVKNIVLLWKSILLVGMLGSIALFHFRPTSHF